MSAAVLDGRLEACDLEVRDGRIAAALPPAPGQRIAIPGLVDIQVNGHSGVDFMVADEDEHRVAAAALLRVGTTAYVPTIVSAPPGAMLAGIASAAAWQASRRAMGGGAAHFAEPLGVHVEGPFISAVRRGVHPLDVLLAPDGVLARRFLDAGAVCLFTVAPELPGALDLIRDLVAAGVVVSAGHSDATAAEAHAAFDAGARTVTHLFNAMRPLHHRDPGLVGAALARDDVTIQMIVDHTHLAPEVERFVWNAARGRLVIVTDAVPPAGLPDGTYTLGPAEITVADGVPIGPAGQLSGGTGTLLQAVQRVLAFGAGIAEAVAVASSAPAELLGRSDIGRLTLGGIADVLIVEPDLSLVTVIKDGRETGRQHGDD